ncbi:MAG TPA: type II secretion system protein GspN [Candidatus Binataceae bacterium]|nr:type II secretion system protein GspN [Candidatus Binataceae bacterium]
MPDFKELLTFEYWRTHRLESGYLATGVVLFFFFLFASFPYASAFSAVLAPMGLRVSSEGQSIAIPIGAKLSQVRIAPDTPGAIPLFESDNVRVAPALLSILLLRPGIRASAHAYDGTVRITAHRSGPGTVLNFSADKVNLAGYEALRALGAVLGGELDATGSLVVMPDDPDTDSGTIHLVATGLTGRVKLPMPPLNLGNLDATLELEKGVLKVTSLKTSGGDLTIDGSGDIRLAPNWQDSALALRFTLVPSPSARMRLAFLLNFLPHPPGTRPYSLGGTLGSPTVS